MADLAFLTRYLVHETVVPAATLEAAPLTETFDLGHVILEHLVIIVPPGHATLTGIAVQIGSTRVLPYGGSSDWITTDFEMPTFELEAEISAPLTIVAFNVDVYEHAFQLRAKVRSIDPAGTRFGVLATVPL